MQALLGLDEGLEMTGVEAQAQAYPLGILTLLLQILQDALFSYLKMQIL